MQKIHHKTIRVIYQSDESYKNLHDLDNSMSIHQKHLRLLVIEIFKTVSKRNPEFIWSFLSYKSVSYNPRRGPVLSLPSAKSIVSGTNSMDFKVALIWNNLSYFVKPSASVLEFHRNLKALEALTVHETFTKT